MYFQESDDMIKTVILFFALVLLVSCDPLYHLHCSIENKSGKTLYVVSRSPGHGSSAIIVIPPDSSVRIYEETGVGFAREKFHAQAGQISDAFVYFSDSALSDSSLFVPGLEWQFHRDGLSNGNASLTIRKRDLR
jgi:hypothetical protein